MILAILIAILAFLLLWILLAPVMILVDTERQLYLLNLPGVFLARLDPSGGLFRVRGRILFVPYRFDPFRESGKERKKKSRRKKRTNKRRITPLKGLQLARDLLGAFRIRNLRIDLDTEDIMLNAWLIPAFSAVNSDRIRLTANFDGNASLNMDVRTRLGSLAWAFIMNRSKSMFHL